MAIGYDKAGNALQDELDAVREAHHPHLKICSIDLLEAFTDEPVVDDNGNLIPILKAHGYPFLAKVKVVSLKDRAKGCADIEIIIDQACMTQLAPSERAAVFDHELTHIRLVIDDNGSPRRDDLGRPKLKIREHDYQVGWFSDVIERHGKAAIEYLGLERMIAAAPAQIDLFRTSREDRETKVTISSGDRSVETTPAGMRQAAEAMRKH